MLLEAPRASKSLQEELVQLPNTSRNLQTSLQEELVQLPNTSRSLQTAYMQPMSRSPRAQNATDNLVRNAAHKSTKQINKLPELQNFNSPILPRLVRRNARSG